MKNLNFNKNIIYRVRKDNDFEFCFPVSTGNYLIGNCYPCDKNGKILEGYNAPIPLLFDELIECTGKNRLGDI